MPIKQNHSDMKKITKGATVPMKSVWAGDNHVWGKVDAELVLYDEANLFGYINTLNWAEGYDILSFDVKKYSDYQKDITSNPSRTVISFPASNVGNSIIAYNANVIHEYYPVSYNINLYADYYNYKVYFNENSSNMFKKMGNIITTQTFNNVLNNIRFNKIEDMSQMFYNCSNLVMMPNLGPRVVNLSNTYYNCHNIKGEFPQIPSSTLDMNYTFYNCRNMTGEAVCGSNVISMRNTYYDCHNLTNAACGNNVIDLWNTYSYCYNITKAVCGPNVINMMGAYSGCSNLINAACSDNVVNMANSYSWCRNLRDAVCGNNVIIMSGAYQSCYNIIEAVCGNNVIYMHYAYQNCYNLINAACGENVADMVHAYSNCRNLTKAPCGNNVKNMSYAYYECINLTDGIIGKVVENITDTYYNCSNLIHLEKIGEDTIKSVGYAFFNCTNLKVNCENIFQNNITGSMGYTFYNCSNIYGNITLNPNITNLYQSFYNCTNLEYLKTTGDMIQLVNMVNSCYNCYSLKGNFFFSEKTNNVGNAFYNCSNLSGWNQNTFYINKNIANFENTFYNCSNLLYFNSVFNGYKRSGYLFANQAFYNCSNLKSVGDFYLANFMDNCFYNCTNLTNINLRSYGVHVNGNYAFYNCCNLSQAMQINCYEINADHIFYNCQNITYVNSNRGSFINANYGFYNCHNLIEINNCRFYGSLSHAMENCFNLTYAGGSSGSELNGPADYAFANCTNLKSVSFPSISYNRYPALNGATNVENMFLNTPLLHDVSLYVNSNNLSYLFANHNLLSHIALGITNGVVLTNLAYAFYNIKGPKDTGEGRTYIVLHYNKNIARNLTNISHIIANSSVNIRNYSNGNFYDLLYNSYNLEDISYAFANAVLYFDQYTLTNIFKNNSKITNISHAFMDCGYLNKFLLDLSPSCKDMSFAYCFTNARYGAAINSRVIPNQVENLAWCFATNTDGFYQYNITPSYPDTVINLQGAYCGRGINGVGFINNNVLDAAYAYCAYNFINGYSEGVEEIIHITNNQYFDLLTPVGKLNTSSYSWGTIGLGSIIPHSTDNVINMSFTYAGRNNVQGSPKCGANVQNLAYSYYNCHFITKVAPNIGLKVTDLAYAYYSAFNLASIAIIPNTVINAAYAFCNTGINDYTLGENIINASHLFNNCSNILKNEFLMTDNIIDMSYMYANCKNIAGPAVFSNNAKNIVGAYQGCSQVTNFATIPLTINDISYVYAGCGRVKDTPYCSDNVINMYLAYYDCHNLTEAVCGNNVINMSGAYWGCRNLTKAVCGDNVQDMSNTYYNCYNLTTSVCGNNVVNMSHAYWGCNKLNNFAVGSNVENLNSAYSFSAYGEKINDEFVSNFLQQAPKIKDISSLFSNCQYINKIIIPNTVSRMDGAYSNIQNLSGDLNIPSHVFSLYFTFNLTNLNSVNANFNSEINDYYWTGIFNGCQNLISVNMIGAPNKRLQLGYAFSNCYNLTHINTDSNIRVGSNCSDMFYSCTNLKKIPFQNFTFAEDLSYAFCNCPTIGGEMYFYQYYNIVDTRGMFENRSVLANRINIHLPKGTYTNIRNSFLNTSLGITNMIWDNITTDSNYQTYCNNNYNIYLYFDIPTNQCINIAKQKYYGSY